MSLNRLSLIRPPIDNVPLFIAGSSANHKHVREAFQLKGYTIVTKEELYPTIRTEFGSNELALIDAGSPELHHHPIRRAN
jgi:thiamine pyrophosphate-dependent acetolactate synthase large subunit-like protein